MFPAKYFAARFFPPRYFPPDITVGPIFELLVVQHNAFDLRINKVIDIQ
jgi:hypothetical protein